MRFRNGSQIYLGNDICIRNVQTWVDVCIVLDRMMSFVMICGVNSHLKLPNAMLNQQLTTGIYS